MGAFVPTPRSDALAPPSTELEEIESHLRTSEQAARYQWAASAARGRDVLDAGCGTGHGTRILTEANARHVTGVDLDLQSVEEAAAMLPHPAEVQLADVADLPFADASFDVVTCFDVIDHVTDRPRVIEELERVLRPEGILLVSWNAHGSAGAPPAELRPHPDELPQLLTDRFSNVELYQQGQWLGTLLEPLQRTEHSLHQASPGSLHRSALGSTAVRSVVLAAASIGVTTSLTNAVTTLDVPFEFSLWNARFVALERQSAETAKAALELEQAERRQATLEHRLVRTELVAARASELEERLARAEMAHARAVELEARLEEARAIIEAFEASLLGRIGRLMYHVRTRLR